MLKSRRSQVQTGIGVLKPETHSVGHARGSRGWKDTPRATDRMRPRRAHPVSKTRSRPTTDCRYPVTHPYGTPKARPRLAQGRW